MLIHATVTITGDAALRGACEARLRRLLSAQFLKNEVTEHHGGDALCYDLKLEGGIPFPLFAQASGEFPELEFRAEWVNLEAGEKGSAKLVAGKLAARESEGIATRGGETHPAHVEVAPDGRLVLALTLFRAGRDEWRGYALTATRDALLRIVKRPDTEAVELYATDGAPEWAVVWRGVVGDAGSFIRGELDPALGVEGAHFSELEQLARQFAADWIWFSAGSQEDTAVERERYARAGHAVAAANVRTSRLHRMRAGPGQRLVYSSLEPEDLRMKDVILATWAAEPDKA